MKCVLVLITVHLCYAMVIHANLNNEMIHNLRGLYNLSGVTFNNSVFAPEGKTCSNASCCLGVFKRELTNVLNNVNVPRGGERYVGKLRANLNHSTWDLDSHQTKNDSICPFKHVKTARRTFDKYITFLKRLNSKG